MCSNAFHKIIQSILFTKIHPKNYSFSDNIGKIFPSSLPRKPRELYPSEEPEASEKPNRTEHRVRHKVQRTNNASPKKTTELYHSRELKASESQTGLSTECATKSKNKQHGEVDKDAVFILSSALSYLISPFFLAREESCAPYAMDYILFEYEITGHLCWK
ncbi:hypothetical protein CEXT_436761 [Caerostris extrusa]|uniref:Uncharacterized protein n=1 Tax=Caerostris extrusa TaxID=172846 RepID=A0AAV4TE06_CAEEX|nr:hypothetical protein CEXT_436761 [Caerostris extrusa]